ILGDLHNLFGDTNAVHVSIDQDGEVVVDEFIKGDTVREVLAYVQYSPEELMARLRKDVERAVRAGKISLTESKQLLRFYEAGLDGYTYLEEPYPPTSQVTRSRWHGVCACPLAPAFPKIPCRPDRGTLWVTAKTTPCAWGKSLHRYFRVGRFTF